MNYEELKFQYGGFWKRTGAILLDGIVITCAFLIIGSIFGFDHFTKNYSWYNIIDVIATWLYFSLMECSSMQATLGKKVFGLKVLDEYGNRIGFGRATGRYFSKYVSSFICCIGYIMAGFTKKKQALHDRIAGTLVVKK